MRACRSLGCIAFGVGLWSIGACASPVETSPPPAVLSDAEVAAAEADAADSGEGFVFGSMDDRGVSIGLRVENPRLRRGEKLRYEVALRNDGPAPILRWLTLPPRPVMLLLLRGVDGEFSYLGCAWDGSHSITMLVDPGETRVRSATPAVVDKEGALELYVQHGDLSSEAPLQSGTVKVSVLPEGL